MNEQNTQNNKTKSGIWIYVLLFLAILGLTIYSIMNLTTTAKDEEYKEKMNIILESAAKYGETIKDRLSTRCYEITIKELVERDYVVPDRDGKVYDPRDNSIMNAKKICITYENERIITYEKK